MKTLILYSTKYGCTKSLAESLANHIGEAKLCNLKTDKSPSLAEFDCIIIGSPLYVGMVRKEVKTYAEEHIDELKLKRIGLYLSGLNEENSGECFNLNFPKEIMNIAHAKAFLGGVFDRSKASLFEKLIMKAVMKSSDSCSMILENHIVSFADEMKQPEI